MPVILLKYSVKYTNKLLLHDFVALLDVVCGDWKLISHCSARTTGVAMYTQDSENMLQTGRHSSAMSYPVCQLLCPHAHR